MNSALPRMVQPVASDARSSLISGVLPIAATMSSLTRMVAISTAPAIRHVDQRECRRSLADDEQPCFLVFGPVPVHLLGEMGDEGAGGHGDRILFVELVSGCDPPRAFDHRDEAVVGMEVRLAEIARLEAVENHVEPALGRIAVQHDLIDAGRAGRVAPFVLIRQGVDDGLGIEAGEFARGRLDPSAGSRSLAEDQE